MYELICWGDFPFIIARLGNLRLSRLEECAGQLAEEEHWELPKDWRQTKAHPFSEFLEAYSLRKEAFRVGTDQFADIQGHDSFSHIFNHLCGQRNHRRNGIHTHLRKRRTLPDRTLWHTPRHSSIPIDPFPSFPSGIPFLKWHDPHWIELGLDSQRLEIVLDLLATDFRASTVSRQASSEVRQQLFNVFLNQAYKLVSSSSLVLFSFDYSYDFLFRLGLCCHVVLLEFVAELSSQGFYADLFWCLWIKLGNWVVSFDFLLGSPESIFLYEPFKANLSR